MYPAQDYISMYPAQDYFMCPVQDYFTSCTPHKTVPFTRLLHFMYPVAALQYRT